MDKQEISETKSSLTKKQNSQTLARWIRKKKKKKAQITKIRYETGAILPIPQK